MNTLEFLTHLRSLNVKVNAESGHLRCHASKGVLTPTLRAELLKRKDDILQFLQEINRSASSSNSQILPVSREEALPLSFSQLRLWLIDQMEPGLAAYNVSVAFRILGALNVKALEQSLRDLIWRHEILRTTISVKEGEPYQVVSPEITLTLPVVDLRKHSRPSRENEAQRLVVEEARKPFDLRRGPLIQAILLQLDEEEFVISIVVHHIAFDVWSAGIFKRDLAELYWAHVAETPSNLPSLSIQYGDFASWQRQWMQGEVFRKQIEYWKSKLGNCPPILELPTDRPRPAIQTSQGKCQSMAIPDSVSHAIKSLAKEEGVTLFVVLLATLKILLSRYARKEDIVVGSPIANRTRAELEGLIGFFVNTVVLRTDLSGDPTCRELFQRVRETSLGAYAHQDIPFEKLVEELQPARSRSYTPFFQVMFALQNAPTHSMGLEGLKLYSFPVHSGGVKFDLTMYIDEGNEGLKVTLEYNTALFDGISITRMLTHYQYLLEEFSAGLDKPLSQLVLLREEERKQLLVKWNDTLTTYSRESCIHELFETQVEQTPEAIAVVCGEEQLTYHELNGRANQFAHYLQKHGVGPEVRVGLCVARSLEMVVGMLGILKAGGAYVPLDPTYPQERLAFLAEDAELNLVLTQEKFLEILAPLGVPTLTLDADGAVLDQESGANPVSGAQADSLAYVMYTSGSTGRPKGVVVPHQAVLRLVVNTDYVQVSPSDRVAQLANAAFDATTFELWGALLQGACVVVVSQEVVPAPEALATRLREAGVTIIFLTTALFNLMARETPTAFAPVRTVLFGGEQVDPGWVAEVLAQGPPERLLHVYGPTESTTFSTWHLTDAVPREGETVPIGRPISNTQVYLVDQYLEPVPVGVVGELYIGGDGLARAYLNQPGLTAEKFVPHPFSAEPGARLYRTGDLARYLAEGTIEFLGRVDQQVKIRGFRIELGEIETVLSQHPAVQEAVVMAREDVPGEKQLVAYVSCTAASQVSVSELRSFLQTRVPGYMIPGNFFVLETLPLTPNGKVDRQALPVPDGTRTHLETDFVAPQTALEKELAEIWGEVLKLETVGIHDDFFELGGHSLLATQLMSRIGHAFQVDFTLRQIFDMPTIALMAGTLKFILLSNRTPQDFNEPSEENTTEVCL